MIRNNLLALVLCLMLTSIGTGCSSAQSLENGTWTGYITGQDNRPQPLSFEVHQSDSEVTITATVLGPNVAIALEEVRWDGSWLAFKLPVQPVLSCKLSPTESGIMEGLCDSKTEKSASINMIPPSLRDSYPTLPPVHATRPSNDPAILNAPDTSSDGSPLSPHVTGTLDTGTDLMSEGFAGGLSVDADGNVYTANFSSHVWKVTPTGEVSILSDEFEGASGNLPLDNGDLLQGEWHQNIIYRLRPDGSRSVFSSQGLDGPVGMLEMPDGRILVANSRGEYLAVVPAEGGEAVEVARHPRMTQPNGVVMDDKGAVFVSDLDSGIVFKWIPGEEIRILVELPGRANAHAAYLDGALYVAKIWDHVIYRVDPESGVFGIVSGTGQPGYDDGTTGVSTMEEPNGIAANPQTGMIYFNTHRGTMGRGNPGYLVIRTLNPE